MKANRFAMKQAEDDEAVSPVIAVILMVAITVVLAATVYVWVSGFGTSGSIKKFPQVTLKDGSDAVTPAQHDELAVIEHRGGDTINWDDYTLKVFQDGTDASTLTDGNVDYDTNANCNTDNVATATGAFSVGDKLYLCIEDAGTVATDDWASGDELKLQIIDDNQNSIVYENTVVTE